MSDSFEHPLRCSVHTRLRERQLKRLLPKTGGRLLDVGCGLGYLTNALGEGWDAVGLDFDAHSLDACKTTCSARMVRGTGASLPFAEGAFDVIVCSEFLEHLPEGVDEDSLRDMGRVLKPGGRILVTVPSLEGLRAHSTLRNLGHDDPQGGEYHYRVGYSWEQFRAMVERVGNLEVVERRYSMFLVSELFMDLLKWVFLKTNKLKEHSDILKSKDSPLFRCYRAVFPLLHACFVLEDMVLAPIFKGHILVVALTRKPG